MNIEELFRDYNIPYVTEGHKHSRPGWVNTICPFCTGNPGYHLGYDTTGNKFVCWRCGGKSTTYALMKLLQKDYHALNEILKHYDVYIPKQKTQRKRSGIKPFKLPDNCMELSKAHRNYLSGRGFDPEELINKWGLLSTGIYSKLDKIDYSRRIIIPYNWDDRMISFDSRDITGKDDNKYKACSDAREEEPRKHILYGNQSAWGEVGICVEGAFDVWRLGDNSFATSGIVYKAKQVREMAKQFKKVYIMYDPDPQAIIQANKLVAELKFRGVEAKRVDIEHDPGDMTEEEAKYWVKKLVG